MTIRKPGEAEFREGAAVTVLRQSQQVAIGMGTAGRELGQTIVKLWLAFMCLLGVGAALPALFSGMAGGAMLMLLVGGGRVWYKRRALKRGANRYRGTFDPVCAAENAGAAATGRYEITSRAASRAATLLFGTGLAGLFMAFGAKTLPVFMALAGMTWIGLAALAFSRAIGDREVLRVDGVAIACKGIFGETKMRWEEVDDARVHSFSFFDVAMLANHATRHCLVLTGDSHTRGRTRMIVPLGLFGLNRDAAETLVALCRHNASVPNAAVAAMHEPVVSPASTSTERSFDPDAAMARYLAEREATLSVVRAGTGHPQARTFGRKAA